MPYRTPSDSEIKSLLQGAKTIAVVGASADAGKPSHVVMNYLQHHGYRVLPVNPALAGQSILGETAYASLAEVPVPIDVVDVFRRAEAVPEIATAAIAKRAKVLWLQLGIVHEEAAAMAQAAGLQVVMDRCMKIEHHRLFDQVD